MTMAAYLPDISIAFVKYAVNYKSITLLKHLFKIEANLKREKPPL
jgi:hypothetical protein